MTAIRLLVLGAVRRHGRAHGYQVRADLESWGAHEWARATSSSVYHPRELGKWRTSITTHLPPDTDLETWGPVGEVIGLWLDTADSRAAWTRRLIQRLEDGAFRMADD